MPQLLMACRSASASFVANPDPTVKMLAIGMSFADQAIHRERDHAGSPARLAVRPH